MYLGNINRRTTVLASSGINVRPYSKNNECKKGLGTWDVAQW
jgi:hypothetical protein